MTPTTEQPPKMILSPPGQPVIPFVNWGGLRALYVKEVRRFFKVQLQTIWGPALSALLFLVIFTVAMGGGTRVVLGHPFAAFVAPGLMMMAMMTSAFANSSFSLLVGKMQGTIVDYLMPPLSTGELMAGLIGAAVTRAVLVGGALWLAMALWPGVEAIPQHPLAVIWFGLAGSTMLGLLGLLTSIWAEKFDHAAAVTNFVVAPLSLLSGTFYSIDRLHGGFQMLSRLNPFFYAISGFRFGFIGITDSSVGIGALVLLIVDLVLGATCYALLKRGWRLKA